MAQKRMFDRAITGTEKFIDMPMSSKALYFLLGMEADDEGFVSARTVMRVHAGTEDDLNILLAKGFCIRFKSGIIVITHWKKNNWLDNRRIRTTEYKEEKALLLTQNGEYVLSNGSARIEENRIEKKSFASQESGANTRQDHELSAAEASSRAAEIRAKIPHLINSKKM
jgi:hypothetical protein